MDENEIKDEIGGMAVEIAGKVIEREISEADHAGETAEDGDDAGEDEDRFERHDVSPCCH